jgi:PhnB protein
MNAGPLASEFPGITPQLTVRDTDTAVAFYRDVFGADELLRTHAPDGRIMHCELLINGGRLLLHDDFPERGSATPDALGGTPVVLHLYVDDVDEVYRRALAAGARSAMQPQDAFWGDRYAQVIDPFGHQWSIATPREDLSVAELVERGDSWQGEDR